MVMLVPARVGGNYVAIPFLWWDFLEKFHLTTAFLVLEGIGESAWLLYIFLAWGLLFIAIR